VLDEQGPAGSDGERIGANRAMWDERVPIHIASDFYGVDAFRQRPDRIRSFEAAEVGDVTGLDLLHLQCHFGLDTLSWATRGAQVTGLDFSAPAIAAASALAVELDLDSRARFVEADVYSAVEALDHQQFDVVFTGGGALNWLPDLARWATVVAELLQPDGFLSLSEFHPFTWVFPWTDELVVTDDYFNRSVRFDDDPGSYTDPGAVTVVNDAYEWHHPIGDVISAVLDAGLRLDLFHEHDRGGYARWPFLEKCAEREYRFPADRPGVPLMYTLRATKPA
jgi:SAM-dependent methyltransferase